MNKNESRIVVLALHLARIIVVSLSAPIQVAVEQTWSVKKKDGVIIYMFFIFFIIYNITIIIFLFFILKRWSLIKHKTYLSLQCKTALRVKVQLLIYLSATVTLTSEIYLFFFFNQPRLVTQQSVNGCIVPTISWQFVQ